MFRKGAGKVFIIQAALVLLISTSKRTASFAYVRFRAVFTDKLIDNKAFTTVVLLREMITDTTVSVLFFSLVFVLEYLFKTTSRFAD